VTTEQYRITVIAQIAGVCLLGVVTASIILGAVPEFRARGLVQDAIADYGTGEEAQIRDANDLLDRAVAMNSEVHAPLVLQLRGRLALQQQDMTVAHDAYGRLERVLQEQGRPAPMAHNGIGCVLLYQATQELPADRKTLAEATERFEQAIQSAPTPRSDAHVYAALARLHAGAPLAAAEHLKKARNTLSFSYEALTSYYSALGSLLAAAAGDQAAAVARKLNDPDPRLGRPYTMLRRSAEEFDKAARLAITDAEIDTLRLNAAIAKGMLLVEPPPGPVGEPYYQLAREWRHSVLTAVGKFKKRFTTRQRQLLRLAAAASALREGSWAAAHREVLNAIREGQPDPDVQFHIGRMLFHVAQSRSGKDRSSMEQQAADRLLDALKHGKHLSGWQRFAASYALAVAAWRANDPAQARKHMQRALATLPPPDSAAGRTPFVVQHRPKVLRNLGIIEYRTGDVPAALSHLRAAVPGLDAATRSKTRTFLQKVSARPVIEDIGTVSANRLPPNMPILTARIASGSSTPLRKGAVSMTVDGRRVRRFVVGRAGRIYALPPGPLAEGRHTIRVDVAGVTGATTLDHTFDIAYPGRD
jgi:tetratricopeptide (TPR) repeat protein